MGLRSFIWIIDFYQKFLSFDRGILMFLAPGGACKYDLSCSEYTKQAVKQKGLIRGIYLGTKRILSCR
ncbi:membrane protein insertion efficiency factor YidD [Candidatus Daviesbacteria bacterium]|nr:membrane protein insertion efficiency factor YidD [Candidatus Daviesbacteria bacterium]